MPNWASTTMRVEGEIDKVRAFHSEFYRIPVKLKTSAPFVPNQTEYKWVDYDTKTPELRMWNVVPAPEEIHDEYFQTISTSNPDHWKDSNNWYEWNIRNWGTKWDISGAEFSDADMGDKFGTIVYTYDTAWGPPLQFMIQASRLFDVTFSFDGFEEGGYAYQGLIRNGEMLDYSESEWNGFDE